MPYRPRPSTRHPRVLGWRGWAARAGAASRRHPWVVDAAMVAVLALISRPRGGLPVHRSALDIALIAGLLLPLIWRRKAPFVVFAVIAAAAFGQWISRDLFNADLAPLIAFYTVAAYERLRLVLAAAAVLEVGALLAAFRFGPNGRELWAFVFISGMVTAAGVVGYNIRTRRAYLAALEDRAARLERERDREAAMAVVAERARIAREMHDIVAHNIAVMIALSNGAAYTTADDPAQGIAIMEQVSNTGRSALAEMRRLLGVMRPDADGVAHTPQPTIADLEELLSTVRAAGLATRLAVTGTPVDLPPSAQLAVYRMVQESLTNALKHAGATAATVRLRYDGGALELDVTNNGTVAPAAGVGHGIAGMRERAAVFGGEVEAGPRPGGGWRVRTTLLVGAA